MTDSSGSWDIVSDLFDALLGASGEEIDSAIRNANLDDASESLLRKMLDARGESSALDDSIDELAADLIEGTGFDDQTMPDELVGMRFGAWLVTEEVARGGMGAVLRAERADGQFEKTVALKVIKPGRYSSLTGNRFLDEMRLLARLEHPNIVRLIDGGISDEGIPWFAMEFVEGIPITEHADEKKLSIEARIRLVVDTCQAVEHAHRNLVVHGDIKPSNILVTDRGQIRLVDFGIARSLSDQDAVTLLPRFTPSYASPELATGDSTTTVSDVFGLSAVLYELLSGKPPRSAESTTTHTDFRALMSKPILSAGSRFDTASDKRDIAAKRGASVRSVRRHLASDLHSVLQRGLSIDVQDRTASVAELREDLGRYLACQPLAAHPASNGYRLHKFLQRHKWTVGFGVLAFTSLAVTAGVALQQAQIARIEAQNARWASDFLLGLFDRADPWVNQHEPITANELANYAVTDIVENRRRLAPDTQARAAGLLSTVQQKLGHLDSAEQLRNIQVAYLEQFGSREELSVALVDLGSILSNKANVEGALAEFRRASELLPIEASLTEEAVNANIEYAFALLSAQRVDDGREAISKIVAEESRIRELPNASTLLAKLHNTRAELLRSQGDFDAARESAQEALRLAEIADRDVSPIVGRSLLALAESYHQQGDSETAIELDRQVVEIFGRYFGSDHMQTLESQGRLAVSLSNLGRMEEAIDIYERVLAGQTRALGEDNRYVATTHDNIAAGYLALGNAEAALSHFQQAAQIWATLDPPLPISQAINGIGLGRALRHLQRYEAADEAFDKHLEILASVTGTEHPVYSRAQIYRMSLLLDLERYDEAALILPGAYATILAVYGADSKHTALAGLRWAQLLSRTGDTERAAELAQQAVTVFSKGAHHLRHARELAEARETVRELATVLGTTP